MRQSVALILALGATAAAATTPSCPAARTVDTVIELYTSEGCSSCPPADRWLSTLKGRADVLALGLHVDYWDRLGWPDRFASPAMTQRQYQLARSAGRPQVYTPHVLVGGQDWRGWPRLPAAAPAAAAPGLTLERDGERVRVQVAASAQPLAGFWAVIEDSHSSRVQAGENRGETLAHDHVVRLMQPVASWRGESGLAATLPVSAGVPPFPRRVAFVLTDASTQRPLRAAVLPLPPGC